MVKHTQTILRQIADELFEYVWPFCEIGDKKVSITLNLSLDTFFLVIHTAEILLHGDKWDLRTTITS